MQRFLQNVGKWATPWSVGLSLAMLYIDYLTGPYVSFPIFFVFPVALLAWYRPCRWAIMLAAFLCAIRQGMSIHWLDETRFDLSIVLINTLIRMVVLFLVALLIARVSKQHRALQTKVRVLEGFLSVCGFCKKIRNEKDQWEAIETFISRKSEAQFSHSICPDCGREHYAPFLEEGQEKPEVAIAP